MAELPFQPVVINVTGVGSVLTSPDSARLLVSASGTGKKAATAVKASATTARKVLKAIDGLAGVAEDTHGIGHASVHERTTWDGEREVSQGWEANHSITITVDQVKRAFDVMSTLADIDKVSVTGPHFDVAASNPAHDQARQLAVSDARAKAASYASAAGLFLGRLVSMSDGHAPMIGGQERTMSLQSLPVAEQGLSASVHLVFEAAGAS